MGCADRAPNITVGLRPKGFSGVFRSSVPSIAILLLSLQTPGQTLPIPVIRAWPIGGRPRPPPTFPSYPQADSFTRSRSAKFWVCPVEVLRQRLAGDALVYERNLLKSVYCRLPLEA